MAYKTIYTEVEVDVDLSEFDTEDLLDELASRSSLPAEANDDAKELVEAIWLKRRLGNHDYQTELDRLIYAVTGKII
jgi:hypothetical protein